MKYFKLQTILVVLIILGTFSGVYANMTPNDNKDTSIGKINYVSTDVSKTIYVAKNGTDRNDGLTPEKPKRNIENAINAANPGETIRLAPGTYQKNIQINKNLTLMGDNQNNTIIDGQGINCICILKATVKITNLTLKGADDKLSKENRVFGGGIHN